MPQTEMHFTLYVSIQTKAINDLVDDLRREMTKVAGDNFVIDVVNVLEMPEQAADDNIFVTPTLMRRLPAPISRIIGNLKDTGNVVLAMNMTDEDKEDKNMII